MKLRHGLWFFIFVLLIGCDNPAQNRNKAQTKTGNQQNATVTNGNQNGKSANAGSSGVAVNQENAFKPFNIYIDKGTRDNHYVPSGFMGDGQCVAFDDAWQKNCQQGSSCIKVVYDVKCSRESEKWVGVYWLNPSNNWGEKDGGYDLTGATKLVFWAKGAFGGEQIQEFTVGGIPGDYPDSDTVVIGPVILSSQWKEYTIDLRGKNLTSIIGGFSWSTSEDVNYESCEFYLDNIRFE